nr:helix-turn-helix transcriptional regulator [Pseudotabrizicola algicola]
MDRGSVDALAARLGVCSRHLARLFDRHVGASPMQTAQTLRIARAKRLLTDTALPLAEVALQAGFGSIRRFNAAFLKLYGRAPSTLRRPSAPLGSI